jgi:hypothetical protein
MSECCYCEAEATYQDNVWGPTTIYCCDEEDCIKQAMEDLFNDAMERCS